MTKEMFNLNSVMATRDSVGEWEGREEEAANAVNMIYEALYEAAPDDIDETVLSEIMHNVWDSWGSEESLPDITDEDVRKYVARVF